MLIFVFPLLYYIEAVSLIFQRKHSVFASAIDSSIHFTMPPTIIGIGIWASIAYSVGGAPCVGYYLIAQGVAMACSTGALRQPLEPPGPGSASD